MTDRVVILMATYNGAEFLSAQLASIAAQTHRNWKLIASDDGSSDTTVSMLQSFAAQHPVTIVAGPKKGSAANFLSLLCQVEAEADYVAFCDQDDIWDADKLVRGISHLRAVADEIPALVGTRSRLIDAQGNNLGLSPLFAKPPCFANALVQTIAGGNTMLWNQAAQQRLQSLGIVNVLHHDWWVYQWISGIGGHVSYDAIPSISYRQHGQNIYGTNRGWQAKLMRIRELFRGTFRVWNAQNCTALLQHKDQLTEKNQRMLLRFATAREQALPLRFLGLWRSGIHRQTALGNVGLIVAALLKRI